MGLIGILALYVQTCYSTCCLVDVCTTGTVAYMSPECLDEKYSGVTTKADIFSFGVILVRERDACIKLAVLGKLSVQHVMLSCTDNASE